MNDLIYIRGNKLDYDKLGNKDWSYEKCLPYFKKAENNLSILNEDKFHGYGGPL